MTSFNIDQSGLRRTLERHIRDKMIPAMQAALDGVYRTHKGRPVEEIKPALQHAWARLGSGNRLTERQLSSYAEAIAEGRRIKVRLGR